MFGQKVVTLEISFCLHGTNRVRPRDIMKHNILGKSAESGEISDGTFCKGVGLGVYAQNFVFCSIYSNGNEFSVQGGLNLNGFQRFNITVLKCARSFHGSTFQRTVCLRYCGTEFMCPKNFIFCFPAPNNVYDQVYAIRFRDVPNNVYDQVHAIRFRDIVITFFLYLPWNCIFMLLLWFMVFGKFQFGGMGYTRYSGPLWSKRKIY